jgi:hypothetical protein
MTGDDAAFTRYCPNQSRVVGTTTALWTPRRYATVLRSAREPPPRRTKRASPMFAVSATQLIEIGFSRLMPRMTMARTIKLYKLPDKPQVRVAHCAWHTPFGFPCGAAEHPPDAPSRPAVSCACCKHVLRTIRAVICPSAGWHPGYAERGCHVCAQVAQRISRQVSIVGLTSAHLFCRRSIDDVSWCLSVSVLL